MRAPSGSCARTFFPSAMVTIEKPLGAYLSWVRVARSAGRISSPASFSTGSASRVIGTSDGSSGSSRRAPSGETLGAPRGSRGAVRMSATTLAGVR